MKNINNNRLSKLTLALCLAVPSLASAETLTGVYIEKSHHEHFEDVSQNTVDYTLVDPKTGQEYVLDISQFKGKAGLLTSGLIDAEIAPANNGEGYTLVSFSVSTETAHAEASAHKPTAKSAIPVSAAASTTTNTVDKSTLTPNKMTRRVAYILYDTPAGPFSDRFTDEELYSPFIGDNSLDAFYNTMSYGQLDLVDDADGNGKHDLFGPYTIEDDRADTSCYATSDWAREAEAKAKAEGLDFNRYHAVVYVTPPSNVCKRSGLASGSIAYIVYDPIMETLSHEYGHILGLGHAGIPTKFSSSECMWDAYRDPTSVMGNQEGTFSLNPANRDKLGWFDGYPGSKQFVRSDQTVNLYPLDYDLANQPVQPVVVKVPVAGSDDGSIYIAYHRDINQFGLGEEYDYTVTVHSAKGINCWYGNSETVVLATLKEGETYEHTADDLTVEFVKAGDEFATLNINMDEDGIASCSKQKPRVEFSTELVQTTDPEGVFDVTATITNLDDSAEGTSCGATTYTVSKYAMGNAQVKGDVPPYKLTLNQGEQVSYTFQLSMKTHLGDFGKYRIRVNDIENYVHIDLLDELPTEDTPSDDTSSDNTETSDTTDNTSSDNTSATSTTGDINAVATKSGDTTASNSTPGNLAPAPSAPESDETSEASGGSLGYAAFVWMLVLMGWRKNLAPSLKK